MGKADQPSRYRTYVVPQDPVRAFGTLRLLFQGFVIAFGTALASRFVLPVLFGESIVFEETTRMTATIGSGMGMAFVALLTITVVRVLRRW